MLRRVENASIEYRYGLIFAKRGHVRLHLGHKMYKVGRITLMDFRRVKLEQLTCPVQVCTDGEQIYWHFKHASIGRTRIGTPMRCTPSW